MTYRSLTSTGILVAAMCLAQGVVAQSDIALETRSAQLQELARNLRARDVNDKQAVRAFAQRAGIPERRVLPNGRVIEFQRFAPGIGPVIYITYNIDAADTVSTDEVWPGGTAGLDLDGNGMTVGEWDGGAVDATHPDLAGRVAQIDGVTGISEHSTHVAGTLIGAGADPFYPYARGMAYAADLDAYDWNSDTAEMAVAAANGLLVSNHSYGIAAGWLYIGDVEPDQWWWIGGADPGDVEDINFGYYGAEAQLWDQVAWDAPYYLIVKASGNDRWDTGPLPGENYTVIDQEGIPLFISNLPRNADCAPAGYDCLPGNSVAKNILTVGAVDDLADGYAPLAGPSQVQMTGFSGWGPTDDGRVKPDIVGNGMWLVSTWPDYPGYAAALGTSMAAPNVTGSILLLQEHYEDLHGSSNFMRAATLKALAIHTADESGPADGPDYAFGWGLLNTKKAAGVITEDGGDHRIIEGSLSDGAMDSIEINVPESGVTLQATLVWADPPAVPVAPVLDAPDRMLVNDLDLRVTRAAEVWLPWVLDPANPAAAADRGDNDRDNVEKVVAENVDSGTYYAKVQHKGTLLDGTSQDYSLIISILPAPLTGAYSVINEDFSGGMPPGWTVDAVMGVPWTVMSPIPGDPYLDNRTGGTGPFAIVNSNFTRTTTSLVTPLLDLSTATDVTLSFNSSMLFSDWETINVDVSTDSGANWTNVWNKAGLLGFPAIYVEDLTPELAEQANAMLRFRYHTFGDPMGYYWQIDNVILDAYGLEGPPVEEDPPGLATNPFPADGEVDVDLDSVLNWSADEGAASHNVFFGASSPPTPQGNQQGTGFNPGPLQLGTTYYWRIDEVNSAGETTGTEWSFSTPVDPFVEAPGQASGSSPADGAVDVPIDTTLSWTAGNGSDSHDVYFGDSQPPMFQGNQDGATFNPGTLSDGVTYYWRIDEVNEGGITGGSFWSFTTAAAPPPPPEDMATHLSGLDPSATPAARGRWTAAVTIHVVDDTGTPVSGVFAEGAWSAGTNGGASCTTGGSGACQVQKSNLKGNVGSVAFTLDNLSGSGMVYDAAANEVATVIVVPQDAGSGNLLPVARDDSFETTVDNPVDGNVMSNDDAGDAPATVTDFDATTGPGGSVSMAADGTFTYTPSGGYSGSDSFGYSLTDSNGDSDAATVSITVNAEPPPPPPPNGDFALTVSKVRSKGSWYTELSWSGGDGTGQVTIERNGSALPDSPTANDGEFSDPMGKKPAGGYSYVVCEIDSGQCAVSSVQY